MNRSFPTLFCTYRSYHGGNAIFGSFLRPAALCSYRSYLHYVVYNRIGKQCHSAVTQNPDGGNRWERWEHLLKPAEIRGFFRSLIASFGRNSAIRGGNSFA